MLLLKLNVILVDLGVITIDIDVVRCFKTKLFYLKQKSIRFRYAERHLNCCVEHPQAVNTVTSFKVILILSGVFIQKHREDP